MKMVAGALIILAAAILVGSAVLADAIMRAAGRSFETVGVIEIIGAILAYIGYSVFQSGLANNAVDRSQTIKMQD